MRTAQWLIYGATGYTGKLIAQEAVRRGHKPVLAARSAQQLAPIAEQLGLEYLVLSLDNPRLLAETLEPFRAILHAAGPYSQTLRPVLEACLLTQTHYVDINGEIPVFEYILKQDQAAQRKKICIIPGAGFDVVPTDCMAVYTTSQLEDPLELDIAISSNGQASAGTRRSTLEILAAGGQIRRSGRLLNYPLGKTVRFVRFADRSRQVIPVPWGDLSTAYYSTGVPNITTYLALSPGAIRLLRFFRPLVSLSLKKPRLRSWLQYLQGPTGKGPDPSLQSTTHTHIYARAVSSNGQIAQAWLETLEAYQLTAISAVACLEAALASRSSGVFTPAQCLGENWVLQLDHTQRFDHLPERPSRPLATRLEHP